MNLGLILLIVGIVLFAISECIMRYFTYSPMLSRVVTAVAITSGGCIGTGICMMVVRP